MKTDWKMAEVWNSALADRAERPLEKRDYMWASEIGAPAIDVWLKMNATPYTNPANDRAKRKFEAGNVFEWIVSLMLKRAGILRHSQQRSEHQYEGLLKVTGKSDFVAGGHIDEASAVEFLQFLKDAEMPDVFIRCFDRVLEHLKNTYPNGIDEMPLEVKSVSTFAMDKMEIQKAPIARHRKQLFHYMKSHDYKAGLIIYLCRDDLRMMEFVVDHQSGVEQEYRADIEKMSAHILAGKMPPKEPFIMFDEEQGKFTKNLGVEWSPYLTMLYNFQEPREYSEIYGKMATNWNRVFKRVMNNDKMTPKNFEVLEQMKSMGIDIEAIKPMFKMAAVEEEETTVNAAYEQRR